MPQARYAAKLGGRSPIEIYSAAPHREPSGRFEISKLRESLS